MLVDRQVANVDQFIGQAQALRCALSAVAVAATTAFLQRVRSAGRKYVRDAVEPRGHIRAKHSVATEVKLSLPPEHRPRYVTLTSTRAGERQPDRDSEHRCASRSDPLRQ